MSQTLTPEQIASLAEIARAFDRSGLLSESQSFVVHLERLADSRELLALCAVLDRQHPAAPIRLALQARIAELTAAMLDRPERVTVTVTSVEGVPTAVMGEQPAGDADV